MNDVLCPLAFMRCHRDKAYLKFVRDQPCCVTGATAATVAHHVRISGAGGVGLKPSDYLTVPLDYAVHMKLHSMGEGAFWCEVGVKPGDVIERLLTMCVQPGTNLEEIFKSQTALMLGDGRVRSLVEAVADWRGTN